MSSAHLLDLQEESSQNYYLFPFNELAEYSRHLVGQNANALTFPLVDASGVEYCSRIYHGVLHSQQVGDYAVWLFHAINTLIEPPYQIPSSQASFLGLLLRSAGIGHDIKIFSRFKPKNPLEHGFVQDHLSRFPLAPYDASESRYDPGRENYYFNGQPITSEEYTVLMLTQKALEISKRQKDRGKPIDEAFLVNLVTNYFNIIARSTFVIWNDCLKTVEPVYLTQLVQKHGILNTEPSSFFIPDPNIFPKYPDLMSAILGLCVHHGDVGMPSFFPKGFPPGSGEFGLEKFAIYCQNDWETLRYEAHAGQGQLDEAQFLMEYMKAHFFDQIVYIYGRESLMSQLIKGFAPLGTRVVNFLTKLHSKTEVTAQMMRVLYYELNSTSDYSEFLRILRRWNIIDIAKTKDTKKI